MLPCCQEKHITAAAQQQIRSDLLCWIFHEKLHPSYSATTELYYSISSYYSVASLSRVQESTMKMA